jgi:hypothetical protein
LGEDIFVVEVGAGEHGLAGAVDLLLELNQGIEDRFGARGATGDVHIDWH